MMPATCFGALAMPQHSQTKWGSQVFLLMNETPTRLSQEVQRGPRLPSDTTSTLRLSLVCALRPGGRRCGLCPLGFGGGVGVRRQAVSPLGAERRAPAQPHYTKTGLPSKDGRGSQESAARNSSGMWRPLRALLLGLTLLALLGPGKCVPIPEDAAAQADDARALRMRLEVVPGADFGKAIGALPKAIASKLRVWEEDVAIEELDARTAIWGEVLISSTTESGAVSSLVEKWDEVQEPLRASLQPFIGDNVVVSLISGDVQKATLLLRGDVPSGNDGDDEAATEREVELVKSVCEGVPPLGTYPGL